MGPHIAHVLQSHEAKSGTGAAGHLQRQLLYREVAPDRESHHHLVPQESGKPTRMHILLETTQSYILCGKNARENPP